MPFLRMGATWKQAVLPGFYWPRDGSGMARYAGRNGCGFTPIPGHNNGQPGAARDVIRGNTICGEAPKKLINPVELSGKMA